MRVRDMMTKDVITAPSDMPVVEARQLMVQKRIRHLLIADNGKLVGIITDRDIRLNLPSPATSLSVWEVNYLLARLLVSTVMSGGVISVGPERDVKDAARIMLDHKIGALPVMDGGELIGILTETDIVRAFAAGGEPGPTSR
jgi:acetoin utilization protein AcuB